MEERFVSLCTEQHPSRALPGCPWVPVRSHSSICKLEMNAVHRPPRED